MRRGQTARSAASCGRRRNASSSGRSLLFVALFLLSTISSALQNRNSKAPTDAWKDEKIRVPETIRTAMINGGTANVNKVADYSARQAELTIEKSNSASAVDEASSRMDAVVAQALDTRNEAQKRIVSEIRALDQAQETAERRNEEETERSPEAPEKDEAFGEKLKKDLADFDASIADARETLNVSRVDATEKERERREEIAEKLQERLAKWTSEDDIGVTERKVEGDIEDARKETAVAKSELEDHSKALAEHAKKIDLLNSKVIPSLRAELRSSALGFADEEHFVDQESGEVIEKDFPNYPDLVDSGQYGAVDMSSTGRHDDTEKKRESKAEDAVAEAAFVEVETSPTPPVSVDDLGNLQRYFDQMKENFDMEKLGIDASFDPFDDSSFVTDSGTGPGGMDLDFYGLTGGATGGTGGATGGFEVIEDATGGDGGDVEFVFPKSGMTRTTVWDLLQEKRYREAVAMAATEASAASSVESKFREHTMRLHKRAERARDEATDLDERVEGLRPVYEDAAAFSAKVAKALDEARERYDRYSHVEKLPLRGRVRFEYDKELKVAKLALDQAISNANVAKEKRDVAKKALDEVAKKRDDAWKSAHSLADEGRAAHHHLLQLKLKATEADSTYYEARKDFYADEVSAGRDHLHQLAREAATVLGPVMDLNVNSVGLSFVKDDVDDADPDEVPAPDKIPAPIGEWIVKPSYVAKVAEADLPLPTPVALVAMGESFDEKEHTGPGVVAADRAERESEAFLRLETVRQAFMQNQLYSKSHAVHKAQEAEERESASISEHPTDEDLAHLGGVGLRTEEAVSAFDKQKEMLAKENEVVHVLQSLENQKLRLRHDQAALEHASDVYEKSRDDLSQERQVAMNLVREAVVSGDEKDAFVMPPLPVATDAAAAANSKDAKKEEDDAGELLSGVLDVLRSGRDAPVVPSFVELDESTRGNGVEDAYRAFVEPANPTNGRSLRDGNVIDLVIPNLNLVDPDESSDVASKMAQHAKVIAEDSAEDAAAAAKLVDTARAGYGRVRRASELSANAFAVADAKARVAEDALGNIEGGATGIAWRAMGYHGDVPSAWMRGNPYEKSTTKLLYDVLEMGPIVDDEDVDSATGGRDDANENSLESEIADVFGIYGPTGAQADAFVEAIKSARQQQEIRRVHSHIYRDEAEQIREENDITDAAARSYRNDLTVVKAVKDQVDSRHERNEWMNANMDQQKRDADAWSLANMKAEQDARAQRKIESDAAKIDQANKSLRGSGDAVSAAS